PPNPVGQLLQRLQGIIVAVGEPALDHQSGNALWFTGAQISRLQEGPENTLARDRILLHELGPARHHAAVILRPWTISGAVDERMPDPAGAELQSFWRAGQEGIDLPIDKQSLGIGLRITHPMDVLVRIKTDELCHQGYNGPGRNKAGRPADCPALQPIDAANVVMCDELQATGMYLGDQCQGSAVVQVRN